MSRAPATTIRRIRVIGTPARRWLTGWTMGVPVALAVLSLVAWMMFRPAAIEELASQRTVQEFPMRWVCASAHRFSAPGQVQPLKCPTCGAASYPLDAYLCREHGAFDVEIEFESSPMDAERPLARRWRPALSRGDWRSMAEGVLCTKCALPAARRDADPLNRRKP